MAILRKKSKEEKLALSYQKSETKQLGHKYNRVNKLMTKKYGKDWSKKASSGMQGGASKEQKALSKEIRSYESGMYKRVGEKNIPLKILKRRTEGKLKRYKKKYGKMPAVPEPEYRP
jgi:hypothetical protein